MGGRAPGLLFVTRQNRETEVEMLSRAHLIMGLAVAGLGAAGCAASASDESEEVGTAEQAFNNILGAPPNYPTAALPFDQGTTRLYSNGDWDHSNIFSPRVFYTSDSGWYFGAECALGNTYHHYLVGISARTNVNRAHSAKCDDHESHGVHGAPAAYRYLSRANTNGTRKNDLGGDVPWNWDSTASVRADCGWHEVVTGVAQLESNEIDGIACTAANGPFSGISQATCTTLRFDKNNHCSRNCTGANDWAVGYYKNICGSNQYMKGVSKSGPIGEISAILCCNWG